MASVDNAYAYPKHFYVGRVNVGGVLHFRGDACHIGNPLAGLTVGIEVLDPMRIRVWLHDLDLGVVDTLPGVDDACFESSVATRMQKPHAKWPTREVPVSRKASPPSLPAT